MKLVCLDFETYYDTEYSLSKMTTEAYVRDPRFEVIGVGLSIDRAPAVWLTPEQFKQVAAGNWKEYAVLAHHAHFDGLILSHHYGVTPGYWFDTLSMSRAIHGSRVGNDLDSLMRYYNIGAKGEEVVKAKGKRRADFTPAEYAEYGVYCGNDIFGTNALFLKLLSEGFSRDELDLIDTTVRMFTEPILRIDEPRLGEYLVYEIERKRQLLEQCGVTREELSSADKFADVLRSLGVEPPTKVSPKGNTIYAFAKSDPEMKELEEDENEDVRLVVEARLSVKSTLNETRTARLLRMGAAGRACPVYLKYYGAHTGRWSGGDKLNWQNLERTNKKNPMKGMVRKCVVAPPGYKIVVADSAQIEARFTGWLAGDSDLTRQFANGEDVYALFASKAYGRHIDRKANPEDEVPGHVGKTCVLGLGYGMGWYKFAQELLKGPLGSPPVQFTRDDMLKLGIDPTRFLANPRNIERIREMPSRLNEVDRMIHCAVANHFVEVYRQSRRAIVKLWELGDTAIGRIYDKKTGPMYYLGMLSVHENGLVLPNGMMLRYPHMLKTDGGYSYLSGKNRRTYLYGGIVTENIVQACCRIIVSDAMLQLRREYLDGTLGGRGKIASMSHDEIVAVVPEDYAGECLSKMIEIMKKPPAWAPGLPLSAEGGIGNTYGEAK